MLQGEEVWRERYEAEQARAEAASRHLRESQELRWDDKARAAPSENLGSAVMRVLICCLEFCHEEVEAQSYSFCSSICMPRLQGCQEMLRQSRLLIPLSVRTASASHPNELHSCMQGGLRRDKSEPGTRRRAPLGHLVASCWEWPPESMIHF